MVVLLVADVGGNAIDALGTDAKGSIAALPFEKFSRSDGMGDKVRGTAFDGFHQGGNAEGGGNSNEQMDMVSNPPHGNGRASQLIALPNDFGVDGGLDVRGDRR